MNAEHIKVIPVLQSENGFYLCFKHTETLKPIENFLPVWKNVYTTRFGSPPAEVRYNEKARLYELGPVPTP